MKVSLRTGAAFLASVAAAALWTSAAQAASYVLNDVEFDDGTFATGGFTTNVYGEIETWDVTTSDGSIPGYHYTPTINPGYYPGSEVITFNRPLYDGFLQLTLTNPLTGSGVDPLVTGYGGPSYECVTWTCDVPSSNVRYVANAQTNIGGPAIVAIATPEPATWATMIMGLGLVGAAVRRRRDDRVLAAHA